MAAKPFQSTYLQMCPQALVEVQTGNQTHNCIPIGNYSSVTYFIVDIVMNCVVDLVFATIYFRFILKNHNNSNIVLRKFAC